MGAVAVGDDDLVPVSDQVHNDLRRLPDRMILLCQILAQGVATQGHYNALGHGNACLSQMKIPG